MGARKGLIRKLVQIQDNPRYCDRDEILEPLGDREGKRVG